LPIEWEDISLKGPLFVLALVILGNSLNSFRVVLGGLVGMFTGGPDGMVAMIVTGLLADGSDVSVSVDSGGFKTETGGTFGDAHIGATNQGGHTSLNADVKNIPGPIQKVHIAAKGLKPHEPPVPKGVNGK
jgi:hypothetical protein